MIDDERERTLTSTMSFRIDPDRELADVFAELETLLKNGDVVALLTARGVNASLSLLAVDALRAYLQGKKADAAEDFAIVAEEIRVRLEATAGEAKPPGAAH